MAANYLHGVETIEVERGPRPVRTVKSAVIGLIGTAPIGAVNTVTLTLSEKTPPCLAPVARLHHSAGAGRDLRSRRRHGHCHQCIGPAIHKTAVASEALGFDPRPTASSWPTAPWPAWC